MSPRPLPLTCARVVFWRRCRLILFAQPLQIFLLLLGQQVTPLEELLFVVLQYAHKSISKHTHVERSTFYSQSISYPRAVYAFWRFPLSMRPWSRSLVSDSAIQSKINANKSNYDCFRLMKSNRLFACFDSWIMDMCQRLLCVRHEWSWLAAFGLCHDIENMHCNSRPIWIALRRIRYELSFHLLKLLWTTEKVRIHPMCQGSDIHAMCVVNSLWIIQ